jgi:5-formyltetrahydrofolate cyclo-ligase
MVKRNKKDVFRKKAFKYLNKKRINNYKKDKILIEELKKFILKNNHKNLVFFIPLKSEVNITALINYFRQKGSNIYVPFMQEVSFKLVKYRLPLKVKKFGIKEPNTSYLKVKKIDIFIVPIIGIDCKCKRVGFGKGMYDRFYEKNAKYIRKTIFVQRDLLISKKTITNSYDIKADMIFATKIVTF